MFRLSQWEVLHNACHHGVVCALNICGTHMSLTCRYMSGESYHMHMTPECSKMHTLMDAYQHSAFSSCSAKILEDMITGSVSACLLVHNRYYSHLGVDRETWKQSKLPWQTQQLLPNLLRACTQETKHSTAQVRESLACCAKDKQENGEQRPGYQMCSLPTTYDTCNEFGEAINYGDHCHVLGANQLSLQRNVSAY